MIITTRGQRESNEKAKALNNDPQSKNNAAIDFSGFVANEKQNNATN